MNRKWINYNVTFPPYSQNEASVIRVLAVAEWCPSCNGTGGRSQYDVGGYDINEMLDMDDDGSFREDYFSGRTDVVCDSCNGDKVNAVPCMESCSDEQKALLELSSKEWQEHYQDLRDDEATRRAENGYW